MTSVVTASVMTQNEPQAALQNLLRRTLLDAQARNPDFSMRALARKLGLYASALNEILNGKRRVSAKQAQKIIDRLDLTPQEQGQLLGLFANQGTTPVGATAAATPYTAMDMDSYHLIADWYHAAILSLVELPRFKGTPEWVGARLGITRREAKGALERLTRLGMLKTDRKRGYRPTGAQYKTSDEVVSLSLRKAHGQNLDLARRSLERDSLERRDFTAITMAVDTKRLKEAKKMIRQFRDGLCAYLEGGKKTQVYKMCIQLIPLTEEEES